MADYTGHCARCHATVTARVELEATGAAIRPAPLIAAFHECGSAQAPGGLIGQAVVLTLRSPTTPRRTVRPSAMTDQSDPPVDTCPVHTGTPEPCPQCESYIAAGL